MSKLYQILFTLLILEATTIAFIPIANATDGYLMFCRTGGKMQVRLEPGGRQDTYIFIDFTKSKVKYDLNNPKLNPGECAWKDRPINSQEPTKLHYHTNLRIFTQFSTSGKGKAKMTAGMIHDNSAQRAKLQRFLDSVMNDSYFTVKVVRKSSNFWFDISSFE